MNGPAVDVIPIGGVGQFGMNCALLRAGNEVVVLDAGMMFPPGDFWGVSAIVPDLGPLLEAGDRVVAIVLTHGHDDHIGGASYLMERTSCPVYGSDLTLGFVRQRLRDRGVEDASRLVAVGGRDRVQAGCFTLEFVHVTHSVPGSFAIVVETPAGIIVHSADFKLDPTPVDGRETDLDRLAARGGEGVRLLLVDSTNAGREGSTPSERRVGQAFAEVIPKAPRRVFLTTFSSHIHRLQQAIDCAALSGRRVAVLGRRMTGAFQIARETGRLRAPAGATIEAEAAMQLPPERCMVIAGGSQGEPNAAMTRIARGQHPDARVERGDVVIHSARAVPGNEVPIDRMFDDLARQGAEILGGERGLHVSGHASRDELATLIEAVRPETLVPVHGTYRHLRECARLAESLTHRPRSVLLAGNGDIIRMSRAEGTRIAGRLDPRPLLVDRECDRIDEHILRERRRLGSDGILVPLVVLERTTGRLHAPPTVLARGFAMSSRGAGFLEEAAGLVAGTVQRNGSPAGEDTAALTERVGDEIRRFVRRRTGKRPLIAPIIIEI